VSPLYSLGTLSNEEPGDCRRDILFKTFFHPSPSSDVLPKTTLQEELYLYQEFSGPHEYAQNSTSNIAPVG
jgi:hypothetical protein